MDSRIKKAREAEAGGRIDEATAIYAGILAEDPTDGVVQRRIAKLNTLRFARWPRAIAEFADPADVVRRYVLSELEPGAGWLTPASKVVTFGSCFARHLAEGLVSRGLSVFYKRLAEDVNTTFANRHLIEWVAGIPGPHSDQFDAAFPRERAEFEVAVRACDLVILTLGVAPSYFDAAGEVVLALGGEGSRRLVTVGNTVRTTTVSENADNIREIIARLREMNPGVRVFLTLSPVALIATLERKSAVLADCVSKSVLRLAAEEVVNTVPDVNYWPSFEIVRWLGPYLPRPPFAEEDGSTRHVSLWMRDLIIGLFIEYFGSAELASANQDEALPA